MLNVAPAYPVPPELLGMIDILVLNETETLVVGEGLGIGSGDPEEVGRRLADMHGWDGGGDARGRGCRGVER